MICRRIVRRPLMGLIIFLMISILFYLLFIHKSTETIFFEENYLLIEGIHLSTLSSSSQLNENDRLSCQLPIDMSPFDSSIEPYLDHNQPEKVECSKSTSFDPLTFVNQTDGRLMQNGTNFHCYYQRIHKIFDDDSKVEYGPMSLLDPINGLLLDENENYIHTKCDQNDYENVHFWFKHFDSDDSYNLKERKPSVIILVIESLSRLNYGRYLNRSRHILEHQYGNTYYLDGMNKLADNSFPNMVPLLTGLRPYNNELIGDESVGPYDRWPFIWKRFHRSGYRTALIEDYPKFTLFNYESDGFTDGSPTDYYPRPFWMHLFSDVKPLMSKLFPFNISPCYKNRIPKIDIFFDQIYQLMHQVHDKPLFAFTFYIEMTHNDFNRAKTIDSHLAQFLTRSSKYLNDSIFILMGDHGNRFGTVLQTTIGRIEERMPLFGIHIPQSMMERHPNLGQNLKMNRRRLATWFDVHQMFNDIVNGNYSNISNSNIEIFRRSYSPWREPIPIERTCEQALIPELYCACDRRITLDHDNHELAKSAALNVVHHLNNLIDRFDNQKKCQQLYLNKIIKAELIFPNDSTVRARGFRQIIEMTISVKPSNGIFRTRLYRTAYQLRWKADGDHFTRIDEYGDQSSCIQMRELKKICFCINRNDDNNNNNNNNRTMDQLEYLLYDLTSKTKL
ncbi:hypothetical protein RDWZM_010136 [Blomia tropicalis]|uniref:Uncharacterized protein n=1 Tax=Blomia tropicalis TaxID=40697 RepID=A0A9Q0RJT1_BLOTA|nr:hypothetical protein RDWZM_010136 [Blomia tropicalis]